MEYELCEPLPSEQAYHAGWVAYFDGLPRDSNPYDDEAYETLGQHWENGWITARDCDRFCESTS